MSSLFTDSKKPTTDTALDQVQPLLVRVRHLIRAVDIGQHLFEDRELVDRLLEIHRTLAIMSTMSERYVIAVAGPQGAGKTTTMHWLYDVPEAYLPMNAITGERLPVLLIEQDRDDFQGYVHRYSQETSSLVRSEAAPDTCKKAAMTPGPEDVMVEIEVPQRVFDVPGQGFLLLPGVEQGNSFHIKLAELVLPTAATAMMCVDAALLARKTVDDEVRRVRKEMQVGDTKLLYAITKHRSKEKAESTASTLKERFDVEDDGRIVTIFPPDEHGEVAWREQIHNAIRQYGDIPRSRRAAEGRALRDTLYALEDCLAMIREKLDHARINIRSEERSQIEVLLDEFDQAASQQRKELKKHLDSQLSEYCKTAKDEVAEHINSEKLGSKLKRLIKGPLDKRIEFQKLVQEKWKGAGDHGPAGPMMNALTVTSHRRLPRQSGFPQLKPAGTDDSTEAYLVQDRKEMIGSLILAERDGDPTGLSPERIQDIRYLMAKTDRQDSRAKEITDNFRQSVRSIPPLALETMRIAFVANSLEGVSIDQKNSKTALEEAFTPNDLTEEATNSRNHGKGLLQGIGAMMGLDYLPDAELDILREISVAVGGSSKMIYLGPAVGALAAVYAGHVVLKSIRQHDLHRDDAAQFAFDRIQSRTQENALSVYDDYMAHVRNHMERVVREKLNVDNKFADYYNVQAVLAHVEDSVRETKKCIPIGF